MKIRTDFVTNSSSSSFVISYKDIGDIDEEILKKYPVLKHCEKIINNVLSSSGRYDETNSGFKIASKKELDKYLKDFCWSGETVTSYIDNEYGRDRYNNYVNHLKNGETLYFKRIDYCDDELRDTLSSMADDGIIEILEDEK